MTFAMSTGFDTCRNSSRTMCQGRAPNTLRTPISFVRRAAVTRMRRGYPRQQRNELCLVEGAAPGKLGRREQLEVLREAVTEVGDPTASTAFIEALHERPRGFDAVRRAHCAACSITFATSAGCDMYTA
jgi:hypothetical protein